MILREIWNFSRQLIRRKLTEKKKDETIKKEEEETYILLICLGNALISPLNEFPSKELNVT